jgi:general stress protein YciG
MTVEEAGRKGGEAPHETRGLQAADPKTRERVARAGGEARGGRAERDQTLVEKMRKWGKRLGTVFE